MSENFEQTLATVENYFSLIFGVLVGNTKNRDVVCFQRERFHCGKIGKIYFSRPWSQNSQN